MPGPQRRDGLPPLLILLFVVFRSTAALEAEISGALKAELAGIALDEQTVIRAVDGQLQPVAAFKLEGHKILAVSIAAHHIIVSAALTVLADLHPFGNNLCIRCHARRLVIFVFPLCS